MRGPSGLGAGGRKDRRRRRRSAAGATKQGSPGDSAGDTGTASMARGQRGDTGWDLGLSVWSGGAGSR